MAMRIVVINSSFSFFPPIRERMFCVFTPPLSLEEVAFMPEESEIFCCVFPTPSVALLLVPLIQEGQFSFFIPHPKNIRFSRPP